MFGYFSFKITCSCCSLEASLLQGVMDEEVVEEVCNMVRLFHVLIRQYFWSVQGCLVGKTKSPSSKIEISHWFRNCGT